jgi:hypothetical protein
MSEIRFNAAGRERLGYGSNSGNFPLMRNDSLLYELTSGWLCDPSVFPDLPFGDIAT